MSNSTSPQQVNKKKEKILDIAADTRKFEIGLFWQRSLFFWGFIAAAFVAYAAIANTPQHDNDFLLVVSSFGFVCSVAWTLANRGSKYWQGSWEAKLETFEDTVLGIKLFSEPYTPRDSEVYWWGNWSKKWHYSVSRLATALSDFTVAIWTILGIKAIPGVEWPSCLSGAVLIPIVTVVYALAMLYWCRSKNSQSPN